MREKLLSNAVLVGFPVLLCRLVCAESSFDELGIQEQCDLINEEFSLICDLESGTMALEEMAQEPSQEFLSEALLDPSVSEQTYKAPRPMRLTARHIESKGIGYDDGYTTLEGFFAPIRLLGQGWLPFADLRGHLFNNGTWAANGGVGVRYLASQRVWGGNIYYDFRETNHDHYNQVSVGFESLGTVWDFRLNGYLPFGKTKSSIIQTKFNRFKGHEAILSSKYEFAMKGLNAEAGYHWYKYPQYPMYAAFGPYYLQGEGKNVWGAELRVVVNLGEHFSFQINTSYDNAFHWIGQGELSIHLPFGPRRKLKQERLALAPRMVQHVDRFEIIPVDNAHKKTVAINPLTGEPYMFWFVNNKSHSDGTFESPFPTLVEAQNASSMHDVIYVYPGDETSNGMDQGIILKNNQRLWGSSINQLLPTTLGSITVPAVSDKMPFLDNVVISGPTVTLSDANEVSGLHLTSRGAGYAILGGPESGLVVGIQDVNIHNNLLTPSSFSNGISLLNCSGNLMIQSNEIANCFTGIAYSSSLPLANATSLSMVNNQISDLLGGAISINHNAAGNMDLCLSNNRVNSTNSAAVAQGILVQTTVPSASICGTVSGNVLSNVNGNSYIISTIPDGSIELEFFDNIAADTLGFAANNTSVVGGFCLGMRGNRDSGGYSLSTLPNTFQLESPNGMLSGVQSVNIGSILTSGTITFVPEATCDCGAACDIIDND